jgi:hypothetical protein
MFLDGKDAASITEDEAKLVIQQVELYLKQQGRSRARTSPARSAVSPGVISEVLAMKYRATGAAMILHLDRWLDQQAKATTRHRARTFIWTVGRPEIETVARLVTQLRKIGLVYGPDTPGIGKTMALQALNQVLPGSLLITIDKVHANPTGLLRAIARALRITDGKRNATLYDRIVEKLSGTPRLLMIDQIHNLRHAKDDKPFYYLTDLWDRTKSAAAVVRDGGPGGVLQRGQGARATSRSRRSPAASRTSAT